MLYQKMEAQEKNDNEKMEFLQNNYPELFNAKFLMDFLKNYFEQVEKGRDENILIKFELFQYH